MSYRQRLMLLAALAVTLAVALASAPLRSEATLTFLDGVLCVLTLTGLALNAALGWWWADPAAALVMVPIIANEGVEAVRGERCECAAHADPHR